MKRPGILRKGGARKKQVTTKIKKPRSTAAKPLFSSAALKAAAISGVVILGVGVVLWWQFVYTDEQLVFEGMLEETLNTRSVTKTVSQETGNQSLQQTNRLQFGANTAVVGRTRIEQTGEAAAKVVTEEVGTPDRDYVRYTTIETTERDNENQELDFQDVLGVWGVSEAMPGQPSQGESFGEAMLGVIPFANVPASERQEILALALEGGAYKVDYLGMTSETENGRPVYTYPVLLQPEPYIDYLKAVASASGIDHLDQLNSADFRGVPEIRFTVRVDVISRQPIEFRFAGDTDREEAIENFGIIRPIDIPTAAIPAQELQQRIQSIQQP